MRDDLRELASGYVLDALSDEERRAFEAEMERSADLRAEVDELRRTVAMIGHAAPPSQPPTRLRARILEEIGATSAAGGAERSAGTGAGTSADTADTDDGGVAGTATSAEVTPMPRRTSAPGRAPWWLAAAASIAAVGAGLAYFGERSDRLDLEATLAERDRVLEEARAQLADRDALLGALVAPDIVTASLSSPDADPSARIFWNRRQQVAVVTAFNLPPAAAGRTYQLWGIDTAAGTAPVSLGTFDTAGDQTAILTVTIPAGATFDLAAVTDEPTGGSPQPTTTPFLAGSFQTN